MAETSSYTDRALHDIGQERIRQEILKAQGRFRYTAADKELGIAWKYVMLAEEMGEVARQTFTQPEYPLASDTSGSKRELRNELVQVAAIAVAWIESLDRA